MDENNLAPTPTPTPAPAPVPETPAPEALTPEAPVAPEVPPVEQQPAPAAPAEKPKKDNKSIIILVVILVVIAVIFGVFFAITNNGNSASKTTTTTTVTTTTTASQKDDEPEEDDDDKNAQIMNTQMQNDLSRVITALNNYQANNRGAIPTIAISNGSESEKDKQKTWQYFIDTYLDTDADGKKVEEPFSEKYEVKVCNFYEGTCKKPSDLTWAKDKNVVHIATRAVCENGEVVVSNGARHVAVYTIKKPYSTMTDKFICMNN